MKQPKLTPDQWQQFNMLQTIIKTFSPNPKEYRSFDDKVWRCTYKPPTTKPLSAGCAIGIFLDNDTAENLDSLPNSAIECVLAKHPEALPKWLKQIDIVFLQQCQELHDDNDNWADTGLTNNGKDKVRKICNGYNLPYELIEW